MGHTTEMQTRIIDLAELSAQDEFPAYAAIYCPTSGNPFVLSPATMRWGQGIFLSRLDTCKFFWLEQKKKLRCKLVELFDPLLRHHYGAEYIAVFGQHPWQCLLYLEYRMRHRAQGVYLLQGRLDRNIYKTLDWDCWFCPQAQLARHMQALDIRGFREDVFRARQARMRRFIERIGVANPHEMHAAHANSIQRRFGKWLGMIWRWSFTDSSELQSFPWVSLRQQPVPAVCRDLEYPVNQWSCIEVLLREDLERLCDQFNHDETEHINHMRWEITLFNQQRVTVDLSFRHPYSLHRDRPGFDTALYQARYIYDDLMQKLQARDTDLDLPESMPFICWRIEVCERVMLAPLLWDLFAQQSDEIDYQRVKALQNKLPLAFECYHADACFFPEQSFSAVAMGDLQRADFDHYPWSCSASNKPLFYYQSAQPIENPGRMQKFFLERNANQWWLGEDALQSIRDYFILKDQHGRSSWVYRTQHGAWFKQGEFC